MSIDLNDPVVVELTHAKIKLLFDHPFFGQMAARLHIVDASSWCKTAAVDGRNFFYNREFIKSLDKAELLFLFGHEVLHCVFDHLGRRGFRDPKLYNAACDFIINWVLTEEKVGKMPKCGLIDSRFTDELTSEEVYQILKKESTKIKMNLETLDEHLEKASGDEEGDGEGKGDGEGGSGDFEVTVQGGANGPPKLTEADLEKIRNEVRSATIQAAQAAGIGNVPAGIRRMIQDLLEPKLDWRALLDAHIRSSNKDDYTYQRISRRSYSSPSRFLFPAQDFDFEIKICLGIDTSGSMTKEMLLDLLSEVKGICEAFKSFELILFTWDTECYNSKTFTPMNIEELLTYEMMGGGGTNARCVFEYLKREGIEPERLVMMTDGYVGDWGDPNYCDTLWIVHSNPQQNIKPPFGLVAYYEEKGEVQARKAA
jgi:predicted metal-dependent peptidase